jgi:lipoprotein-releasing system permease protein
MRKVIITIGLVILAPLWVPVYLVAGLCGLCTDGLLFQLEGYLRRPLNVGRFGRAILSLPSLVLFPALSTVDVTGTFLLSAGRWPLFLALDGLLVVAAMFSVWAIAAWFPGLGGWLFLIATLLQILWLTLVNTLLQRLAWLLKALSAIAAGFAAGVGVVSWMISHGHTAELVWYFAIPGIGAGCGVVIALLMVILRSPFQRSLFETWEPSSALGNLVALMRGVVAVLLMPAWFPVLAFTWLVERIFARLILPDMSHRVRKGGWGSMARPNRFSSFVGLRYMKGKRDQRFVSVITVLSILAVAMGVWTLTVVLSVMSGFEVDLRNKILGTNSHVVVLNYVGVFPDYREAMEKVAAMDDVRAVTPFVYTELMVKHNDHVTGAIFKGVDTESVADVTDLVRTLKKGPSGLLTEYEDKAALLASIDDPIPQATDRYIADPEADLPGIFLGEEMAMVLRATVGDIVLVTSPFGEPGPFGTMVTTMQKFRVKGIFYSGMYEYDTKFLYVSIPAAQRFLKFDDEVTGLEVVVDDLYAADDVARSIERELGYPFWARDWMAMNRNLFAALKLEKVVMAVILSFIYVGAALNIIVVLIMVVMEKQKEIAILRAMGSTKTQLMKAFMIEGLIIGFVGTTIGTVLGFATCLALDRFRFIPLDTDVYYLDSLPVAISPWTFLWVAVFAVTISFLATLYPSWYGAELDPVEGLRYE